MKQIVSISAPAFFVRKVGGHFKKPDYYFLAKAGLSQEKITKISECEDQEMQIRLPRKYRYELLDKIHEKQQSFDAIDYMICKIKEQR